MIFIHSEQTNLLDALSYQEAYKIARGRQGSPSSSILIRKVQCGQYCIHWNAVCLWAPSSPSTFHLSPLYVVACWAQVAGQLVPGKNRAVCSYSSWEASFFHQEAWECEVRSQAVREEGSHKGPCYRRSCDIKSQNWKSLSAACPQVLDLIYIVLLQKA